MIQPYSYKKTSLPKKGAGCVLLPSVSCSHGTNCKVITSKIRNATQRNPGTARGWDAGMHHTMALRRVSLVAKKDTGVEPRIGVVKPPKSSILLGVSIIFTIHFNWGTLILGNTHTVVMILMSSCGITMYSC